MPDDLRLQEEPAKRLCPLLGLPSICQPETEADDLIASLTRAAEAFDPSAEIVIASADKDLLQLVSERVSIYSTAKADLARTAAARGADGTPTDPAAGFVLLGPSAVIDKWGVPPGAIAGILSLTGDNADNIPGVPGVGEKTAAALLLEFGSLDAILAAPERIAKMGLRQTIRDHRERILQNREMVRLDEDIPSPLPWNAMELRPDPVALLEFLRACEFRSLLTEVATEFALDSPTTASASAAASLTEAGAATRRPQQTDFFADLESLSSQGAKL
jgi:DNA polymerase-1